MAINRRIANENLTIWSWNCRSLHNKHATLTLYIKAALVPPDVICLQEVGARPKTVSGYKLYMDPNTPKIATLVRKELAATCITAPNEETQHLIVTLWPAKKGRPRQVICNIYSPPQDRKAEFSNIFHYLNNKLQPRDRLIITGDFNAWHTTWGYSADRPKGTRLLEAIQRYDYTLLTTPGIPTRIGNSVNRDTTPDLTVTNNAATMRWSVLDDNLGSDHNIVQITYETARLRRPLGKARLTNWTKYREQQEVDGPKPTTIAQWTPYIKGLYDKNTKIYQTTTDAPAIDTHLTHLWEARRGLTKRWRRQKLNKKLRLRIAKITEEVNAYSKELYNNNWRTFCDSLKGTLSTKKTWNILRSLLDPSATRTETNATLQRLAGEFQGDPDQLIEELKQRYTGERKRNVSPTPSQEYNGEPNTELDAPITFAEVYAAAQSFKRNTAPGLDGITNAMVRNLSDEALQAITDHFNQEVWTPSGKIPAEWTLAQVVLIPKPGKRRSLDQLRPISLTSCIGKLFEKVILTRLDQYTEERGLLPTSMYGFRRGVSTQDIFLLLKEEVLNPAPGSLNNLLVALDIEKAFDNIAHSTILDGLAAIGCGQRIFNYASDFLGNRKAQIGIAGTKSSPYDLPLKGTPQGSILSPFLFNIGLRKLVLQLETVPNLGCAFYADDITLWATKGSYGERQDVLQTAIDMIQGYLTAAGMSCAPSKSEYLQIRPPRTRSNRAPALQLEIAGQIINRTPVARILGMHVQENNSVKTAIGKLKHTVKSIASLIARIARSNDGMTEADTVRLVQAFVLSRVTFALPFQSTRKPEIEQIDRLIRIAYKAALRLPNSTSTEKLMGLGMHNTYEELAAATLIAQRERLTTTLQGRTLLQRLGYPLTPQYCGDETVIVPKQIRDQIIVEPVPKNMHPLYNKKRRQARARKLLQRSSDPDAYFTDVSLYPAPPQGSRKQAYALAVTNQSKVVACASLRTRSSATAEAAAIALAIREAERRGRSAYILTDSQAACRLYLRGTLPRCVTDILGSMLMEAHGVTWCPGHDGLGGNEEANCVARGLTGRDAGLSSGHLTGHHEEQSVTSRQILENQRLTRRTYAPPHPNLSSQQARDWRRLQTNTYPHISKLHAIFPQIYTTGVCPWCSNHTATLTHITYQCTERPANAVSRLVRSLQTLTTWSWEARLSELALGSQLVTLDQARRAAVASGALQEGSTRD